MNEEVVLKMLVEMGVINAGQIDDLRAKLDGLKTTSDDAASSTKELTEADTAYIPASMQAGEATEAASKSASNSRIEHMALHHAMTDLNRICPGLGTVMYVLSNGFKQAGESAEGGAGGVRTFGAALDAALPELLVITGVILGIQLISKEWDNYTGKVKAAAEANSEAMQQIYEDTKKASGEIEKLNEALNPKTKGQGQKDKDQLDQQLKNVENNAKRQRDLNKVSEEREMAGATTPQEKKAITEKYAKIEQDLTAFSEKVKASIETQMAASMTSEIAAFKKQEQDIINARLAQQQDEIKQIAELKAQKDALNPHVYGAALAGELIDKKIRGIMDQGLSEKEMMDNNLAALRQRAGDMASNQSEISGKANSDTSQAGFDSETNRQVAVARLQAELDDTHAKYLQALNDFVTAQKNHNDAVTKTLGDATTKLFQQQKDLQAQIAANH